MQTCSNCQKTVKTNFAGNSPVFCCQHCREQFASRSFTNVAPKNFPSRLQQFHLGNCPLCSGPGPIDFHESHFVYSVVVLTFWNSKRQLSCLKCGTAAKLQGFALCCIAGWWGFPFGLIITPVQLLRNCMELLSPPKHDAPSQELVELVSEIVRSEEYENAAYQQQRYIGGRYT